MKKPSAFITGIAGFAGSYLAEELLEAGFKVSGSIYATEPTDNIAHLTDRLELHPLDILEGDWCRKVLSSTLPDYVFHLAAIASVGESFQKERATFKINFDGTVNMLAAARELRRLKRFLFVGSSDSYGRITAKNKTLTEEQPFAPVSPYGIAKAAAEHTCRYYHDHHGLPATVVRAFNHSGPRQNDSYVIPSFARQIAAIEAGKQRPVIKVGDLSARRDLSDVRDIVRGYRLAATEGKSGEVYQLCSGRAVAIKTVLDTLLSLTERKITVKVDERRLRPSDIPVIRGSNHKAAQKLGYQVRYRLKDTLRDTLDYWRSRYGQAT